jgi:Tfp pilus assembly protein PilZ
MWDGINRRKFPRVRYKTTIELQKKDSSEKISTYTENIGAGGICVVTKENPGLFKGVDLEVDLRNGSPSTVKCSGTVVWVVKKRGIRPEDGIQYDIGIEFIDIDTRSKEKIGKIVEEALKKNPENRV